MALLLLLHSYQLATLSNPSAAVAIALFGPVFVKIDRNCDL